ncbi:MAG: ATP cone domain-containing protein, partial [Candidatus Gracilibacteria bacterium]
MKKIIKRDGTLVDFNHDKIAEAIWKAAQSVGGEDRSIAEEIAVEVEKLLNILFKGKSNPTVEQVQDLVENMLIERKHAKTAKAYILYRQKQTEIRDRQKAIMGKTTKLPLSLNALQVLERRYLLRDKEGRITESPEDLFRRVAHNIALADKNYENTSAEQTEEEFYNLMTSMEFM